MLPPESSGVFSSGNAKYAKHAIDMILQDFVKMSILNPCICTLRGTYSLRARSGTRSRTPSCPPKALLKYNYRILMNRQLNLADVSVQGFLWLYEDVWE